MVTTIMYSGVRLFKSKTFSILFWMLLSGFMIHSQAMAPKDDSLDSLDQTEISKYEKIVTREPENTDALVKLANLLYSYHRSGEAVPLWKKAIAINPRLVEPHWSLGSVYDQRGDTNAAESEYLQALKIDPGHVGSRSNLAVIYREKGELSAAENEYRTILKMQSAKGWSVHHDLGQILAKRKRWSDAIEQYRLELQDEEGRSMLGTALIQIDLAEALRNTGKLEEAEKEIREAQEFLNTRESVRDGHQWRAPRGIIARADFELACIRAQQERLQESVRALADAISLDSSIVEKIEASDDLKKVRATHDYKKLAEAVQTRRQSALDAHFTATIKWIEVIGKREATIAFAEPDARWLIAIDIASIEKPSALFDKPGEVILAIHSPAKLLARSGESAPGTSYDFQLGGEVREGKPVYQWVRAHELTRN